jgi:teichuronic acid biosynthesis glycosyltransferase TuaG
MTAQIGQPLVSVVMPAYNQAAYIHEAIASVLSQTHLNLQLVIIDNYSTDLTNEIVGSFDDKRIQYYKFRNHGVIATARNYGVSKCGGEYIAFIDSDDVWEPLKLEQQIPHMRDVSFVSSSFKSIGDISESGHYLNSILEGEYQDFDYGEVALENPVITSSALIHRNTFLRAGGFDENQSFKFIEDWELWLRLAYWGPIRVLNKPLVQYRIYYKPNRDMRDVRKRVLGIFDKHHHLGILNNQLEKKARGNCYISIGKAFLDVGDYQGIVFYVKGLFYSYGVRNKLRVITGLLLFVLPKFIRTLVVRKAWQLKHLLALSIK